jgi:hypothetical protein
LITPTSSNKNGDDKRLLPAMGYEFIENGQSICALQYFGGGTLGANKNIVWLRKSANAKMDLILAAAMTAILQLKNTEMLE